MPTDAVSLPKAWPNHVRSAILQVVSLAHFAIAYARGWTANAINPRARQAAVGGIMAWKQPNCLVVEQKRHRAEKVLADLAIGDRIESKTDGGRRPEAIQEISVYHWGGPLGMVAPMETSTARYRSNGSVR